MFDGVNHGPTLELLADKPVEEFIHFVIFVRRNPELIFHVLVMIQVHKSMRRFVQMIIGAYMILMRNFSEHPHILDVRPADIDVEEDQIPVFLLPLDQVPKLGLDGQ
jgi:hypothetical protein